MNVLNIDPLGNPGQVSAQGRPPLGPDGLYIRRQGAHHLPGPPLLPASAGGGVQRGQERHHLQSRL